MLTVIPRFRKECAHCYRNRISHLQENFLGYETSNADKETIASFIPFKDSSVSVV